MAVNAVGTAIHSGLETKLGTRLLWLIDMFKVALRYRLLLVKFLNIDELSMVSSDLWTDIDSRLGEIFMTIPEKAFAGFLYSYECSRRPSTTASEMKM